MGQLTGESGRAGEKLRIIQVVNVRWVNATAWYALFLSRLLREAGHQVLVLGLAGTRSFDLARQWGLEPQALPLNSGNPLTLFALYRRLAGLVRSFRPQVVNCHRGESFVLWGLLKKKTLRRDQALPPFALIRTRGDRRPLKNNAVNRALHGSLADAVIATNSEIARSLEHEAGVPPAKIHTILGGVDENVFYPDQEAGRAVRASLGYTERDFVVGLLGRLDQVKGHAVLIRALREVKAARSAAFNFKLLCIGADSALGAADIEAMLAREGLAGAGLVTGRVENVRAHINALNLGVLASVGSEAIARAALEIMACDVPLLSSDIGVMPDLLPRGLLLPAGDAGALALALERYGRDRDALEALRRAGAARIVSLKSGALLRQTLGVYRDCLARLP
jgi:glycosyltransferase involved in cell wall biosynthesis